MLQQQQSLVKGIEPPCNVYTHTFTARTQKRPFTYGKTVQAYKASTLCIIPYLYQLVTSFQFALSTSVRACVRVWLCITLLLYSFFDTAHRSTASTAYWSAIALRACVYWRHTQSDSIRTQIHTLTFIVCIPSKWNAREWAVSTFRLYVVVSVSFFLVHFFNQRAIFSKRTFQIYERKKRVWLFCGTQSEVSVSERVYL